MEPHNECAQSKSITAEMSTTQFTDLNDFCLLKIFERKLFDLADVSCIADTCKTFEAVTKCIVPREFNFWMMGYNNYRCAVRKFPFKTYGTAEVHRIFEKFGSIQTSVSIGSTTKHNYNYLFDLVTTYCEEDLINLSVENQEISVLQSIQAKPIFNRLQKLHMKEVRVNVDIDPSLFNGMVSLVDLKIMRLRRCSLILKNLFPQLERFDYEKYRIVETASVRDPTKELSLNDLTDFVSRHTTLKTLKFRLHGCNDHCQLKILEAIGNHCKELQECNLDLGPNMAGAAIRQLQTIKSLEKLSLRKTEFDNNCSALTGLRELNLLYCQVCEDSFDPFIQLKKLFLDFCVGPIDVVRIVSRHRQLEELEIWSPEFTLDEETFKKIAVAVAGRSQVLVLKCDIRFHYSNLRKCQNVKIVS